ncbi:MAG: VWA domain-containing protein [Bacteroidaceae bacterium]|nr:VWA domain-containing protein [Bacteroidaceae bacterium]
MKTKEVAAKRVFNLIIVDESGSMSIIRKQAFTGMNETLQTVRQMQKKYPDQEQRVTLVTFDSDHTTWHYNDIPAQQTTNLSWEAYSPCGATPLYDAMGTAISKVNAQVAKGDNVLVTVITDGEENSSQEWTLTMIRTMIEKLKKQHWTFTLIGTDNLDVEAMARSFAIDEHLEFHQDVEGTRKMFERERRSRERYCCCLAEERDMPVGSFFEDGDDVPDKA